MAFTLITRRGDIVYNVSSPVGATVTSAGNFSDDVKLIQVLFKTLFYKYRPDGLEPPPGATGIKIDGICGPSTQNHMRQFKEFLRKTKHAHTVADGKIDPFEDIEETSAGPVYEFTHVNHDSYVMVWLLTEVIETCQDNNDPDYYFLDGDSPLAYDKDEHKDLWAALQRRGSSDDYHKCWVMARSYG